MVTYSREYSWRGVVGVIKPGVRPGSLEEFLRLLPEGIGVVPLSLGIKKGTEEEFLAVMELIKEKVAELAARNVDLIHAEGAPPFMIRGYQGEQEIVKELEEKHGIPIFTSGMSHIEALRALGVKRFLGVTYFQDEMNQMFARYFRDAGFDVLGIEEVVPFAEAGNVSPKMLYSLIKKQYLKHRDAQGIYMLGSGWSVLDVINLLERDLQIPVVHPVPARIWAIQKRLLVREPRQGYGRLLEELP